MKIINKSISNNFKIQDKFEVGIVLSGPEVKSAKAGKINFKGAYCSLERSCLYLKNFYIAPYLPSFREQRQYSPNQPRRLLLRKAELIFLIGKLKQKGVTVIPLRIYTKNRLVKLEIASAQGLKKYDKREKIKDEEFKRRKQKLLYRIDIG